MSKLYTTNRLPQKAHVEKEVKESWSKMAGFVSLSEGKEITVGVGCGWTGK